LRHGYLSHVPGVRRLRQYLYFSASKASKLSTCLALGSASSSLTGVFALVSLALSTASSLM